MCAGIGDIVEVGKRYSMEFHPTFIYLRDGDNSLTFVAILFPDGTEWTPIL